MKEIILASASLRRSRILSDCGIAHRIVPSGIEESVPEGGRVSEIVKDNARRKAEMAAVSAGEAVVIGADTLVLCEREIIGKPEGEAAARNILAKLSGNEAEVYTGVCVIDMPAGRKAVGYERSTLKSVLVPPGRFEKIFRLLAPYDKAGGFSIEGAGALLFDNIKGSYFNILGLPMIKLGELFRETGLDILDFMES